ncbi:MAG TPA: nuclear transport factor 2 family protein [Steroidobacteraceae bacterium]|nr:nuclear transport factor 2 family protein [Steroidobacteraceae bacterium]
MRLRELAALERLRAADYVQTDLRGGVLTRAEWLSLVKNRPSTLSIECENIEVRFDGATALVTGGWTYTNHKPGADVVSAPAGPRGGGRSTGRGSGTPSRTPTSILRPTSALRLRQR